MQSKSFLDLGTYRLPCHDVYAYVIMNEHMYVYVCKSINSAKSFPSLPPVTPSRHSLRTYSLYLLRSDPPLAVLPSPPPLPLLLSPSLSFSIHLKMCHCSGNIAFGLNFDILANSFTTWIQFQFQSRSPQRKKIYLARCRIKAKDIDRKVD